MAQHPASPSELSIMSTHTIHKCLPITPYSGSLAHHSDVERTEAVHHAQYQHTQQLVARLWGESVQLVVLL